MSPTEATSTVLSTANRDRADHGGLLSMGWVERCTAIFAGICTVAAISAIVAHSQEPRARSSASVSVSLPKPSDTPAIAVATVPTTPKPTTPPVVSTKAGAVTTKSWATLRAKPKLNAKALRLLPAGVLLPVIEKRGDFFKVFTPHEVFGWVHTSKLRTHAKAGRLNGKLEGATIVIDPGHGGHLPGAKGMGGFLEKDANLGISKRLVQNLKGARVFMTRNEGHAGLAYRSSLANRLGAHAFISVHNNALPDKLSKTPGTEIYHQKDSKESKRLAGLLYEELSRALKRFGIKWGRDPFAGAKYRRSQQHGGDYYAVLRRTLVPAVIVEGMFITNRPEERLLRKPQVRQLMADALAKGIRRFIETDDKGSGYIDPYAKPTPNCPIPGCFEHRK